MGGHAIESACGFYFHDGHGLRAVFHPQLGINITDVALHGGHGNDQLPGDILVGKVSLPLQDECLKNQYHVETRV